LSSLRNRLALVFFVITLIAIGAEYAYVAPGLRSRLVNDRVHELAADATRAAPTFQATIGGRTNGLKLQRLVDRAGQLTGVRATLLSVSEAVAPPGPQLATIADSAHTSTGPLSAAWAAVHTGKLSTGTQSVPSGSLAVAADPLRFNGQIDRILVFSSPVADIVDSVGVVRHQIAIAGALALALALIGGYLTAGWLARRVKRLERAAERVAGGEFGQSITVDSRDELGQLARTFNKMQLQLEQLDTARKRFIATASHELRTPIFSLGGFVELLEDDDLDPATRRRFLGHVSEQVERLSKLSVDLLDLSRLESGSLELRPEQVDLGELTRSVAAEFELTLAAHDSHLELHLLPRSEAFCDPVRTAQIVRILIDNALTHTPPGTRIVLTTRNDADSVSVSVGDDGTGIPSATLARVFEPFFTTDDAQGSGLGLAIARELAERMGGSLTVSSAPDITLFELRIPSVSG
jgi:signal transduction histidine kinase